MKRLDLLAVLMVLSSPAAARESFSFTVGGHHIHIELPSSCRSTSCVSVSIPGIYQTHRRGERHDEPDAAPKAIPAPPILASVPAAAPPAVKPAVQSVACPPPAVEKPAAASVEATPSRPPAFQPPKMSAMTPRVEPPAKTAPVPPPAKAAPAAPIAPPVKAVAPPLQQISHDVEVQPGATPLGDWRTEAKAGSVRIEACGRSLCGYVLDPLTGAAGETVMFDMRPLSGKVAPEWSGSILSRSSGNSYYATIAMDGPNALRVEACALGRFFCSANIWSRIASKPEKLITSRQIAPEPRS